MTTIELEMLQALQELEDQVKTMATADPKPNLLPLFSRIEDLARELPKGTDPALVHYLQRKSYGKARLFLEEKSASR